MKVSSDNKSMRSLTDSCRKVAYGTLCGNRVHILESRERVARSPATCWAQAHEDLATCVRTGNGE